MERQGSGAIVNCASVGSLTGNPGIPSYIASKHGVIGLTRTAALEVVRKGIRVNAVNPGLIDTQIGHDVFKDGHEAYAAAAAGIPIGRAGRPEEIASAVLWLCSPGASYVIGEALTVDGGMTVDQAGGGGFAQAAPDGCDRSVLSASGGYERADRGRGRRGEGVDRGRQGEAFRPLGSRRGDDPARARGPAGDGGAKRILALASQAGGGSDPDAGGTRHRVRALQPAGQRFSHRQNG